MTNADIARKLREHAAALARAGNNLYRVRAFRQAAFAVSGLPREVADVVAAAGPAALLAIPGIGASLAGTIADYATRGAWHPRTPVANSQVVRLATHRERVAKPTPCSPPSASCSN